MTAAAGVSPMPAVISITWAGHIQRKTGQPKQAAARTGTWCTHMLIHAVVLRRRGVGTVDTDEGLAIHTPVLAGEQVRTVSAGEIQRIAVARTRQCGNQLGRRGCSYRSRTGSEGS